MTTQQVFELLGILVVAAPALLLIVLGVSSFIDRPLSERAIAVSTQVTAVTGLVCALAILGLMLILGTRRVPIDLGNWVALHEQHFHFNLEFVFDRLSVPFVILSFVLCGTIGAFAAVYIHLEAGFNRFFSSWALFLLGMVITSVAGTIETLFLGWELVGLSSALLVAFYQERPSPVINGLRVWIVYRIADAAFLVAALTLHHLTGQGDFAGLMGQGAWPEGVASISTSHALLVGLLLLVAAAGKSAMIPFSGWLPRAMEGPTPSSAIFYGALSVHLGAFLLLRVSPILEVSGFLSMAVVCLGLLTAIYGALAGRVQTDIKSALCFASMTQVGLIFAEIGIGLRYIPLIHIIGHASLRSLQLLRAPSLLRDNHILENAVGTHLQHKPGVLARLFRPGSPHELFLLSLERGYLDAALDRFFTRPFNNVFEWLNKLELRWIAFLSGETPSLESAFTSQEEVGLEDLV